MQNGRAHITIKSFGKTEDGWEEASALTYDGMCGEVNGSFHVIYEEEEESGGRTRTHITARETDAVIRRSGEVDSVLEMDPARLTVAEYRTRYGAIPMEVRTHAYALTREGQSLTIQLRYDICQNGKTAAENRIRIEVRKNQQ